MDFRELRASMCHFRTKIPPQGIPENTRVNTEVELKIIITSSIVLLIWKILKIGPLMPKNSISGNRKRESTESNALF